MLKELAGNRGYGVLRKKGIQTEKQAAYIFPRNYYDFTQAVPLTMENTGVPKAYVCKLLEYKTVKRNNRTIVRATVEEQQTKTLLGISWFNASYMQNYLDKWYRIGELLYVCGKATFLYEYGNGIFCMTNPTIFEHYNQKNGRIYTVYPHYSGISDKKMREITSVSVQHAKGEETVPWQVYAPYRLPDISRAIHDMHFPANMEDAKAAARRLAMNDLLYLAAKLEMGKDALPTSTEITVTTTELADRVKDDLPYTLTKDQMDTCSAIINQMIRNERVDALVQGDVGCGKTIIAFLLMFVMAENGYQSVLYAPTTVLARQHFTELKEYAEKYGLTVVYVDSFAKVKEKRAVLEKIANGEADFIVGTHNVLQETVVFHNLGLAIADEEHRFGVEQKEVLAEKAQNGVHMIEMSATPIPRTLASTIYAGSKKIYNVKTMPAGRKPVETFIASDEEEIFMTLNEELRSGRQAYVVCPLIEGEETDLATAEDTYLYYAGEFGKNAVELLHGKMSASEKNGILERFQKGEVKIIVSTTVVEVGVNNPNASVIIINNAERFGLATLHQLRGRVGRGSYQGICILMSEDEKNERLQTLCHCSNGFDIAEADYQMRGSGNLIGTEQSGNNKLVEQAVRYPNVFARMKELVKNPDIFPKDVMMEYIKEYEQHCWNVQDE